MKSLFSPYLVKRIQFKNRIVMPSVASFLFNENGIATDQIVDHYRRRAAGGPAAIILEACSIASNGFVSPHQGRIYHDRYIEGLLKIANAIKKEGCVPGIQLHHCGRQTSPRVIKSKPVAPSPLVCPTINKEVHPLSIQEIQELVTKFGDAAHRAEQADFELIEIHGAHGYLINQFLSSFSNVRDDEYGGNLNNRSRFAEEIVKEIRNRISVNMPLSFKISAQEFVKNGLSTSDSISILKILIKAGIDIVQVSAGNDSTPEWIAQPIFMEPACLKDSAAVIKKAIGISTMVVGRINDPHIANEIIKNEQADLICIGRGLIADPDLPMKVKANNLLKIRPCVACNHCMDSIFKKGQIKCSVNPIWGREFELTSQPLKIKKRVMIIGGGVAGMCAGWHAAIRGCEVHLFEKEKFLGGQLRLAGIPEYKKDIRKLIQFYKHMIKESGVTCHLRNEITLNKIQKFDPEVIVIASGSTQLYPDIQGINNSIVVPITKVMNNFQAKGAKIIIIGGGQAGCDVAFHLSTYGAKVIIIEKLSQIGKGFESITRKVMLKKLTQNEVQIMTETQVSTIDNNGVSIISHNKSKYFQVDYIVISIGNKPVDTLSHHANSLGYKTYTIGDCLLPRSAKEAIYEGTKIGMSL